MVSPAAEPHPDSVDDPDGEERRRGNQQPPPAANRTEDDRGEPCRIAERRDQQERLEDLILQRKKQIDRRIYLSIYSWLSFDCVYKFACPKIEKIDWTLH